MTDLCNAPIIGRDGKPLGFECNLDLNHFGQHAQTTRDDVVPSTLSGGPDVKA